MTCNINYTVLHTSAGLINNLFKWIMSYNNIYFL